MIKKFILTSVAASLLLASPSNEVKAYLQKAIPASAHATVGIIKSMPIKEIPNVTFIYFKIDGKFGEQRNSVFYTNGYIVPDFIKANKKISLKQMYTNKIISKKLLPLIKKEDPANIISIGHNPDKGTVVVFSDPECPFCRNELKNINNVLKEKNIKVIFTPIHGLGAERKAALIYQHIKPNMSDAQKIKIFNKYFDPKFKAKDKVDMKRLQTVDNLKLKYAKAGLSGVPTIVPLPKDF